ncbi:hypothetical protein [Paenibacillus daejeonensis]|uniref:hypothetical protein n=1 Tax=Paenibacillus daejeonensis TaxID=135193 RepID=UPI0003617085|nr:hypothetical protein [Paenibacillus daejeonensis]
MTEVWSTITTMWRLQATTWANRLIYYAQRLPLLNRLVNERAYAAVGAKRVAGIAAVVLMIMAGLASSFLYLGVMIALPLQVWAGEWADDARRALFVHMYFCLSVLLAGVSSAKVLEPTKIKYIAVRLMRIAPTRYMRATILYRYATFFLYQLIAMLVIGSGLGITLLQAVLLVGAVTLWRVGTEWLHLALYRWSGIVLVKKTGTVMLITLLAAALAYLPLTPLDVIPAFGDAILGQPFMLALLLVFGLVTGYLLLRKTDYTAALRESTNRDDPLLNMQQLIADAQQKSVQASDKDYSENRTFEPSDTDEATRKKGYAYTHQIFMTRHRSLIRAPLRKRLSIIGVLGVVLAAVALTMSNTLEVAWLGEFVPFVILAMLYFAMGDHLCKTWFYHCDMPLMRYRFYRKDAVQHFRLRLGQLLRMNVLIGTSLAAVLTVSVLIVSGGEIPGFLLPLWLLTLSLAVFFSVHHLLLYYVLQPYTTELNTKNPFFFLINSVFSGAFVATMLIRPNLWVLAVIVVVLTLTYVFMTGPLVTKFADRRFRVK